MLQRSIIVAILFIAVSCSSSHKPQGKVLPKEVMIPLLVDIHLAEAKYNTGNPLESGRAINVIEAYDSIFTHYKIEPEDFYTSFRFYRQHPAQMDSLYQDVLTEFTKRQTLQSKKVTEAQKLKSRMDSLKARNPQMPAGEP
jgi:hypothetical protein